MLDNKRLTMGWVAAFAALGLAEACSAKTTDFESGGGDDKGGGSTGTGGAMGGTSQGGSAPSGGSSASGGSTAGASSGASSGGSGASSSGGAGGTDSGGANSGGTNSGGGGTGATGGVAGTAGSASGASGTGGGSSGAAGAGGAPISCNQQSDAMDMCGRLGASCLCCPLGGAAQACMCTTQCTTSADCRDAARPVCNIDTNFAQTGICAPDGFICRWGSRCAAPNTPIATPSGERPIAELRVGDLVYSVEGGAVVAVPIRAVSKLPVTSAHTVSRVTLVSGAVLEISPGHPTAEGRSFGELHAGDALGDLRVKSVTQGAPYAYPFTHDILPASSSGTYFAAGALIASTLADDR